MEDFTRREWLNAAAVASVSGIAGAQASQQKSDKSKAEVDNLKADRARVIACGMTEAEADCWELIAKAAGKFFELPKLHPMDDHEVAHAIHVVQHKLLSRPTYRRYLELAKATSNKK